MTHHHSSRTALFLLGITIGLVSVATRTDAFSLPQPSPATIHQPSLVLIWASPPSHDDDCSDPGMEGAAEERAVMLAQELFEELLPPKHNNNKNWNEKHLARGGAAHFHEESNAELEASEDAAAWDAHDCSNDAGMEAAAEERAVVLARELMHDLKMKQQKKNNNENEK